MTYLSLASRGSVQIALTIEALNYLDILLCEIQNTYLTSEFRERVWIVASPGFGSESGQCMIVKKVLC